MDRDVFVENCLFALVEYYQEVSGLFFLLGLMAVKEPDALILEHQPLSKCLQWSSWHLSPSASSQLHVLNGNGGLLFRDKHY